MIGCWQPTTAAEPHPPWPCSSEYDPKAAVISSGYANRFGHPHPLVIQRLHDRGVKVFSTASDGALEFEVVPGQPLQIEAFREIERRYWM